MWPGCVRPGKVHRVWVLGRLISGKSLFSCSLSGSFGPEEQDPGHDIAKERIARLVVDAEEVDDPQELKYRVKQLTAVSHCTRAL